MIKFINYNLSKFNNNSFVILKDIFKNKNKFYGTIYYKYNFIYIKNNILISNNFFINQKLFFGNIINISNLNISFFIRLKDTCIGNKVFNLESIPNTYSKYIRSAGSFGKIITFKEKKVLIKLPSGKIKFFSKYCVCCLGQVFGEKKKNLRLAGTSRKLGINPKVRGVAKNAVDHPHGGGTGKSSIGHRYIYTTKRGIKKGQKTR